ncbi:hypothetical protein K445DRAFT_150874 [Daldinia sp. EC12]|nr:hypothetical protein K445DRAFT_150874 [Daldinia sp. EC12]
MASEPIYLFSQLNITLRCCIIGLSVKKRGKKSGKHAFTPPQKTLYNPTCIPTNTPESHQYFIIIR